jgi:hypothetical protein
MRDHYYRRRRRANAIQRRRIETGMTPMLRSWGEE